MEMVIWISFLATSSQLSRYKWFSIKLLSLHSWYVSHGWPGVLFSLFLKKILFYFLERGREKNISVWLPHMPPTVDLAHNPGVCPRLGIEPATLWFAGQHSIYWATPARAGCIIFLMPCFQYDFMLGPCFMRKNALIF